MSNATLWAAAAAGLVLVAWAVYQLRVVVAVACGYKAKVLCTAIFGSGRDLDPQMADEIHADSYIILRPFRASIDRAHASVTASFVGLGRRTAIHRPAFGATLRYVGSGFHLRSSSFGEQVSRSLVNPAKAGSQDSWPAVPGSEKLQRIVDDAFGEPNPERLRRTHAIIVVHDGTIVAERYARGVTANTPLPGWSAAKSVLSALVGMLVAEGRLALDQQELRPEWRSPDPRAAICLEDLLRMRSGLRFAENYANPWSDVLHMLFNCPDAAAYAASRPLAVSPGTVWQYASGTTNIISSIARRTLGDREYATWPRRVLFDRLGMESAVLEPDASGTFVFSSFMLATARDWARYGQLWLDGGVSNGDAVISPEWVRWSTTATPQSPEGRFGAHWWLKLNPEIGGDTADARAIPSDTFFAIGHEAQTLTVIPSKRLVVVRMGASIYIDAWNHAAFTANIADAF